MFATILAMALGFVVGSFLLHLIRYKQTANKMLSNIILKIESFLTIVLVFAMGANLGSQPDILSQIGSLGAQSLLFFLIPTSLAIAAAMLVPRLVPLSRERTIRKRIRTIRTQRNAQ